MWHKKIYGVFTWYSFLIYLSNIWCLHNVVSSAMDDTTGSLQSTVGGIQRPRRGLFFKGLPDGLITGSSGDGCTLQKFHVVFITMTTGEHIFSGNIWKRVARLLEMLLCGMNYSSKHVHSVIMSCNAAYSKYTCSFLLDVHWVFHFWVFRKFLINRFDHLIQDPQNNLVDLQDHGRVSWWRLHRALTSSP